MMSLLLVPVIKDKEGKVNSSDNYRPISLDSVLSKVVELIVLEKINTLISSEENQFGYKPMAQMCVFIYIFFKKKNLK